MSDSTLPSTFPATFQLFAPPYRHLTPLSNVEAELASLGEWRGSALVWRMSAPVDGSEVELAQGRPPGIALMTILPRSDRIERPERVLRMAELCRPQHILPHHGRTDLIDLRNALSRPPDDLASEVTDYLAWRGVDVDVDTRRLIRKTVELSGELRTVQGLARSLYLSRRALGRRFMDRGLPVPSHWLQVSRLLRAVIRLQNSDDTLLFTASCLGYPDGFALSNQMKRLTDLRPSDARRFLGWEWVLESWLRLEAREGRMAREFARIFGSGSTHASPPSISEQQGGRTAPRQRARSRQPQ